MAKKQPAEPSIRKDKSYRDVDDAIHNEFKKYCALKGRVLGRALTDAMKEFMQNHK